MAFFHFILLFSLFSCKFEHTRIYIYIYVNIYIYIDRICLICLITIDCPGTAEGGTGALQPAAGQQAGSPLPSSRVKLRPGCSTFIKRGSSMSSHQTRNGTVSKVPFLISIQNVTFNCRVIINQRISNTSHSVTRGTQVKDRRECAHFGITGTESLKL